MTTENARSVKKPKRTIKEKLEAAEQLIKQLREQAKAEAVRKAKAETKIQKADDNRRRILLGTMALKKLESNEAARAALLVDLDTYLTRESDRKLFNLPSPPAS